MGKTVFITGSSRGIGFASAWLFASAGFNVAINGIDEERLKVAESKLLTVSKNIFVVPGDMANYEVAKAAVERITSRFGSIDVLVNNAAISHVGLFTDMQPCEWDRVLDVNIKAALNCAHLTLPDMVHKKSGCIVNISSIWGERGASCEVVYSLTKGAVNSFTKALAKEVAPSGVRVNAVACGVIDTDMNAFLTEEEKLELIGQIGLSRFGTANEVAEVVLFLASEKASYITGQVVTVDGGIS